MRLEKHIGRALHPPVKCTAAGFVCSRVATLDVRRRLRQRVGNGICFLSPLSPLCFVCCCVCGMAERSVTTSDRGEHLLVSGHSLVNCVAVTQHIFNVKNKQKYIKMSPLQTSLYCTNDVDLECLAGTQCFIKELGLKDKDQSFQD